MRVLLDTNMMASAILGLSSKSTSSPAQILRQWRRDAFELIVSEHILLELERTLAKPYFAARMTSEEVRKDLTSLRTDAVTVEIIGPVRAAASHPEDDLVLAAAASGSVKYLVTGDVMLQKLAEFDGTAIVSPQAFLLILAAAWLPPNNNRGMLD